MLFRSVAKNITEEFGGLPLGLEQAGAYMEEAKLSPDEYLDLYRREGQKLRDRPNESADHDTVTLTFSLAYARLSEPARQIIRQVAFLAPEVQLALIHYSERLTSLWPAPLLDGRSRWNRIILVGLGFLGFR